MRGEPRETHIEARIRPSLKADLRKMVYDKHDNPGSPHESLSAVIEALLYEGVESANFRKKEKKRLRSRQARRELIEDLTHEEALEDARHLAKRLRVTRQAKIPEI